MDFLEENMTAQEMLEKIAQLDHSTRLLKEQNAEMRSWLDASDEDLATLRSENTSLKKQVKELEKVLSDAQSVEAEPANSQPDFLDFNDSHEMKIQKMEKECVFLEEENKKLMAEIRNLQQLQEQDDVSLNKFKVSLQILESEREVTQLGLRQRDEVIQQKCQELKHAEEIVEEYSTMIQDLRLTNQQLKDKLEAGQDEVSFANAIDLLEAKERSNSPVLSFAEELRMLDSSIHNNISQSDVAQTLDEAVSENIPMTPCSVKCQDTGRCFGLLVKVVLILVNIFLFFIFAVFTSGSFAGNSCDTFWSGLRFLFEPYCTVHHGGMPPI